MTQIVAVNTNNGLYACLLIWLMTVYGEWKSRGWDWCMNWLWMLRWLWSSLNDDWSDVGLVRAVSSMYRRVHHHGYAWLERAVSPNSGEPRRWRRRQRRCVIVSQSLALSFRLHRIYGFAEMKWNKLHMHCINYRSYRSTVASSDVLSTHVTRVVRVSETLELYFWTRILEHLTTVKMC